MDIQIDIPLGRQLRRTSQKRTRSPTSPTLRERPQKRVSSGGNQHLQTFPEAFRSKDPFEDDRAQSTQRLHIVRTGYLPIQQDPSEQSQYDMDVDTPMAFDDSQDMKGAAFSSVFAQQSLPHSLPDHLQPYTLPPPPTPKVIPSSFVPPTGFLNVSYVSKLPQDQAPTSLSQIEIMLHPPTPQPNLINLSPHKRFTTTYGRSQTPPGNTPRTTPKAPTMGPRADCEKCRMHTPGHWMHYD